MKKIGLFIIFLSLSSCSSDLAKLKMSKEKKLGEPDECIVYGGSNCGKGVLKGPGRMSDLKRIQPKKSK